MDELELNGIAWSNQGSLMHIASPQKQQRQRTAMGEAKFKFKRVCRLISCQTYAINLFPHSFSGWWTVNIVLQQPMFQLLKNYCAHIYRLLQSLWVDLSTLVVGFSPRCARIRVNTLKGSWFLYFLQIFTFANYFVYSSPISVSNRNSMPWLLATDP